MELLALVPDREARVPLAAQLADALRTAARAGAVRVGELGRQRNARLPVRHKREKLHEWPPGIGSNWPS